MLRTGLKSCLSISRKSSHNEIIAVRCRSSLSAIHDGLRRSSFPENGDLPDRRKHSRGPSSFERRRSIRDNSRNGRGQAFGFREREGDSRRPRNGLSDSDRTGPVANDRDTRRWEPRFDGAPSRSGNRQAFSDRNDRQQTYKFTGSGTDERQSFRKGDVERTYRNSRDHGKERFGERSLTCHARDPGPWSRTSGSRSAQGASIPYTTAASQFLYGTSAVEAALRARRRKLYTLYVRDPSHGNEGRKRRGVPEPVNSFHSLRNWAKVAGVPVKIVGEEYTPAMDRLSENRPHNGCILEASPLPLPPVESLQRVSLPDEVFRVSYGPQTREEIEINGTDSRIPFQSSGWRNPLLLLLDGVKDEGNLVSRSSATLSPITLKSSAGAAEAVRVFSVADPVKFLADSSGNGWQIFAADTPPDASKQPQDTPIFSEIFQYYTTANTTTKRGPTAINIRSPLTMKPTILMLGSEGEGLSYKLKSRADYIVSIASATPTTDIGLDSLNVSVTAGMLAAEFMRDRRVQNGGVLEEAGSRPSEENRLF